MTLMDLGIPRHIIGYDYMQAAIQLVQEHPELQHNITGMDGLYAQLAERFHTTSSRMERALRYAVEHSLRNLGADDQRRFFGRSINLNTGRIPNSQYIATAVEVLKDGDQVGT